MTEGYDRGEAAARLLRMLDERSQKRRPVLPAPPLIAEQLDFDLSCEASSNHRVVEENSFRISASAAYRTQRGKRR